MRLIKYLLMFLFLIPIQPLSPHVQKLTSSEAGITVHYKGDYTSPHIYYWDATPSLPSVAWPGILLEKDADSDW